MRRDSRHVLSLAALFFLVQVFACSRSNDAQPSGSRDAGGSEDPEAGPDLASAAGGRGGGSGAGSSAMAGSGGSSSVGGTGGAGAAGGASPPAGGTTTLPGTGGFAGGTTGSLRDGGPSDGAVGDATTRPETGRDVGGLGGAGREVGTDGTGSGGAGGNRDGGPLASITVWLAGDSTMANGSTPCPVGWGKAFQAYFNSNAKVVNSAQGGRSVQTWLYDVSTTMGSDGECTLNSTNYLSEWTAMLDGMKPGDYLFIQFGINDGDSSCNRHVGTALFQKYFGVMAQAAKDRGATPIFVTPVSSISCSGSTAKGSRGTYSTATKQAGTADSVTVIDLEQRSVALYNSLGFCPLPGADTAATFESGAIGDFFCEDHTHFEAAGAKQIAGLVAQALRDQSIGLADYLLQ